MAELRLGEGALVLLDDEDLSKVRGHAWFPLTFHGTTYAVANIRGADGTRRQQRMHQLLLGAGPADINFPERREEYKRLTTNNPALNEMRKLAKEVG